MKQIAAALIVSTAASIGSAGAADMSLTPQQFGALRTIIQSGGYQCPEAKIANSRGLQPTGLMIRVYCGPAGSSGVIESLVYQVFLDPDSGIPKAVRPGKGP